MTHYPTPASPRRVPLIEHRRDGATYLVGTNVRIADIVSWVLHEGASTHSVAMELALPEAAIWCALAYAYTEPEQMRREVRDRREQLARIAQIRPV